MRVSLAHLGGPVTEDFTDRPEGDAHIARYEAAVWRRSCQRKSRIPAALFARSKGIRISKNPSEFRGRSGKIQPDAEAMGRARRVWIVSLCITRTAEDALWEVEKRD
jgi:hypothetical protein